VKEGKGYGKILRVTVIEAVKQEQLLLYLVRERFILN